MAKIVLPSALRRYCGNCASIEVAASTVGQALEKLTGSYPEIKPHLFDEKGQLRRFVNLYVGNNDIRHLNRDQTALADSDELLIIPALAGGVTEAPALSPDELARYDRHLNLPEVGRAGQEKLKAARVLMIGTGGLCGAT